MSKEFMILKFNNASNLILDTKKETEQLCLETIEPTEKNKFKVFLNLKECIENNNSVVLYPKNDSPIYYNKDNFTDSNKPFLDLSLGMVKITNQKGKDNYFYLQTNKTITSDANIYTSIDRELYDEVMHKELLDWALNGNTGLSSKTMARNLVDTYNGEQEQEIPYDISDLERCIKMVQACPSTRPFLNKISKKLPYYKPLIERFEHLESLHKEYTKEKTKGIAYERFKEGYNQLKIQELFAEFKQQLNVKKVKI